MSFIEGIKKKFLGEETQIMKAPKGGRRVGSMGKAYTGGGGTYVSTSKGVGFDASTYNESKPRGKVSNLNEFNPNRSGSSSHGEKGILGKAYDYAAPKAKAAGNWLQDRGMELNGDAPRKRPSPYKKGSKADKQFMTGYNSGMVAQGKAPFHERTESPAYERAEHRGRGHKSERHEGHWMNNGGMGMGDLFGVGNFGMGPEPEERDAPRRRKKSRRRAEPSERDDDGGGFTDMYHIPDHLKHMF